MRCLHVIPGVAPRYGGPSQVVFQMGRALLASGADVRIATTNSDGPSRLPVETAVEVDYEGVPSIFFRKVFSESFKFSPSLARWLRRSVADFDLVHIHAVFSHSSLAAAAACRRAGVPYLLRPLGSLDPWSLDRKRWQKRMLGWMGVDAMLHQAAAIHYTTDEERRLAESGLKVAPGIVIPIGIEIPRASRTLLEGYRRSHPELANQPYVLVLSRLHPKKCLELLLQAFARATRDASLQHWRLVLAGSGEPDYVRGLERLAAATAGNRVLFAGWLSGDLKSALLAGAELVALTSRQENFGVAAAEAMVCDVPVLLSRHVNLSQEVMRVGAGWVCELDEEHLATTLASALESQTERQRRGKLGGDWARRRFSWDQIVVQLRQAYDEYAMKGVA